MSSGSGVTSCSFKIVRAISFAALFKVWPPLAIHASLRVAEDQRAGPVAFAAEILERVRVLHKVAAGSDPGDGVHRQATVIHLKALQRAGRPSC